MAARGREPRSSSDESLLEEQVRHHRLADQASFVVYGTIAVLAAVGGLALEAQALRPRQAAAVLIVVAFAAWLSHTMWRVVRARGRRDAEPARSHEVHELLRSWPILASGLPGAALMLVTADRLLVGRDRRWESRRDSASPSSSPRASSPPIWPGRPEPVDLSL